MTWLLVTLAILVLMATTAVLGTRIVLRRKNRVVVGVRSPAPLGWLTSSRREARLHRRLRAAGRRLEMVPSAADVADVVAGLQVELVELDDYLVTVARRPSAARRAGRPELVERVTAIEDLTRRIEERSRDQSVSLDDLTERLDLLEAADDELRGLDPG